MKKVYRHTVSDRKNLRAKATVVEQINVPDGCCESCGRFLCQGHCVSQAEQERYHHLRRERESTGSC